jgi:hypothetical protein
MGVQCVAPIEVGAHAGNHAHAALAGRGYAFAEEVAVVEEFSMAMERHPGGIEGEDAGDTDKDDVRAGGMPIIGPLLDVHHGGVVLGHVGLADAANPLLPGFCRWVDGRHARRQSDEIQRAGGWRPVGDLTGSFHRTQAIECRSQWNCGCTGG